MTNAQIKNIHIAKSRVGLSEEMYRSGMEIIAGVRSSKLLDQPGYEACMAWMEDLGWVQVIENRPVMGYWRAKVGSPYANTRLQFKVNELYAQYDAAVRHGAGRLYPLVSLIGNATEHRTTDLRRLYPREAMNLIEMLKDKIAQASPPASASRPQSGPAEDSPWQAEGAAVGTDASAPDESPVGATLTAEEIPF
jgi:hypothetical protein